MDCCEELIETLWNVNTENQLLSMFEHPELIETLWNVNLFEKMEKIFKERGINRNIVECKLMMSRANSRTYTN